MKAPDEVSAMLRLKALGWGSKRIAAELGCARNTVRHWHFAGQKAPETCLGANRDGHAQGVGWVSLCNQAQAVGAAALSPVRLSAGEHMFCGSRFSFFTYDDQSRVTQRSRYRRRSNGSNFHVCSIGRFVQSAARKRALKQRH